MDLGLLTAYSALLTMAVLPIYLGSFASVKWPKKSKQKHRKSTISQGDDSASSDDESSTESLSAEDAFLFPVIGSGVLFTLYLLFKLLDKDYVNYLVTAYFAFLGVISVTTAIVHLAKQSTLVGILFKFEPYKFVLTRKSKEIYKASFTIIHLISILISFCLTVYYVVTKNWIASNIFGLAFAFNGITMLSLDSFRTGMILLSGLFFYDIFWVFGTEVMVTVAKSFDAPIKVVWPKKWFGLEDDEQLQFTMLGLGDIVVPGIYVALCLRFDHSLYIKNNPNATKHSSYSTTYFNSCFAAYILGLIITIVVMHTFKAAQPALLYLSPACIFSVLLTGIVKNQLNEILSYSSDKEEKEKKVDEEKKKKEKEKDVKAKTAGSTKQEESDDGSEESTGGKGGSGSKSAVIGEDYVEVTGSSANVGNSEGGNAKSRKSKKSSKKKNAV